MPRPAASARLTWLRERGMGSSILVAALSSAFGVVLISATGFIAAMLRPTRTSATAAPWTRPEHHDRAPRRRGGLRRRDRHGQHVLDRRRRADPADRPHAAHRRVRPLTAGAGRTAGARRRGDRRAPRPARRHGARGRRGSARDRAARPRGGRLLRRPRLAPAARCRRRPDDVGGGLGGFPPRADRDAAAGARRLGRGIPRGSRSPQRSQRHRHRALHHRRRPARTRHPGRAHLSVRASSSPSSAASCRSPDSPSARRS